MRPLPTSSPTPRAYVARRRAVFVITIVIQLVVLYWPRQVGDGGVPGLDKVVHCVIFALAAWAGVHAGVRLAIVVPALAAHAVVSEVIQGTLLPNRSGDPLDSFTDLVGVALGVVVALALERKHVVDSPRTRAR